MAFQNGAGIVTRNLFMYYNAADADSYAGSGATWFDMSGNSRNGTLINSPTYTTTYGGGLRFNGTNQYVSIPNIDTNNDMTAIFTFNYTASGVVSTLLGGTVNGVLQIRVEGQVSPGYYIQLNKSNTVAMGQISGSINLGVPMVVAISFVKSTSTYYGYYNGVFQSSFSNAQTLVTTSCALGYNLQALEYMKGFLYNFSFYNRTLTAEEIFQNFSAQRSRYNI